MVAIGAVGIVYGALLALVQTDLKRLAAYSTLAHLSFIVVGIFTFTSAGLNGGIYQILNESLAGAAFFILLGLLYERYRTYEIRQYGGLATRLPWMVTMFVITGLAMVGLPMLNGFVGEFLILSGSMQTGFTHHIFWTTFATLGVILSAAYMLTMIQRVFYGGPGPRLRTTEGWDLDAREHLALWPLIALFLVMGVLPSFWLRSIDTVAAPMAVHQLPAPQPSTIAAAGGTR
jgi:NADH-quinone oxidoreductase subunit M